MAQAMVHKSRSVPSSGEDLKVKSGLEVVVVVARDPIPCPQPFQGPSELDLQMVIRSSSNSSHWHSASLPMAVRKHRGNFQASPCLSRTRMMHGVGQTVERLLGS